MSGYGSGALVDDPGPGNKFRMTPKDLDRASNKFERLGEEMAGLGNWLADQLSGT